MIVVDDGSADPAAVRAVAERAGAAVLRHPTPRGPAAARNAGLAAARTPLVAFLDSDVVPEPGWLEPLLARLADPAVGLVAPRIVALPPVTGWLGRYEAVRSSLDLGPDPALVVPRSRVAYVPSAALLVRREAVGPGFDEDMHVAEDVDLVLRLHAAGWRLRYEPTARVAHDHRTSLRAWWLRKAFYGTGAAPLALRHRGAVPPMVLSPWAALTSALLLARRPGAAAAVSAVAAYRLSTKLGRLRHPRSTAARLIALGAVGAAAQTADAVTRHYWPLAVVAALCSRRARGTVAAVALGSGVARLVARGPRAARPARVPAGPPPRRPRLRRRACGGVPLNTARSPRCGPSDPPRGLLRKTESHGRPGSASAAYRRPSIRDRGPVPRPCRDGVNWAQRPSLHRYMIGGVMCSPPQCCGREEVLWHRYGSPSTA